MKIPCVYISGRKARPFRGDLIIDFNIGCILFTMSCRSQPYLKESLRFIIQERITSPLSKSVWYVLWIFLMYLSDILFNSHNHLHNCLLYFVYNFIYSYHSSIKEFSEIFFVDQQNAPTVSN